MGLFSRSVPSVEVQASVQRRQETVSTLDKSWCGSDLAPVHFTLAKLLLFDGFKPNSYFCFNDVDRYSTCKKYNFQLDVVSF